MLIFYVSLSLMQLIMLKYTNMLYHIYFILELKPYEKLRILSITKQKSNLILFISTLGVWIILETAKVLIFLPYTNTS